MAPVSRIRGRAGLETTVGKPGGYRFADRRVSHKMTHSLNVSIPNQAQDRASSIQNLKCAGEGSAPLQYRVSLPTPPLTPPSAKPVPHAWRAHRQQSELPL